jgi:glycosylphosphatidylinositol transamidase (GPIT) subunit GPI8
MTGHGGDEFLKFQDTEEISAFDIADAFETMWQKKRYVQLTSLYQRWSVLHYRLTKVQRNLLHDRFVSSKFYVL